MSNGPADLEWEAWRCLVGAVTNTPKLAMLRCSLQVSAAAIPGVADDARAELARLAAERTSEVLDAIEALLRLKRCTTDPREWRSLGMSPSHVDLALAALREQLVACEKAAT